jgi:uncharacterized NAD(P)/FAD-binding protein YdhS
MPGKAPIAVIGAGFSGTMVALHLAETLPPDRTVLLCERAAFACGPAYASRNAGHLLNVRAANMSAFPDRPAHFEHWLAAQPEVPPDQARQSDAGLFVSRGLYGSYLCDLLDRAVTGGGGRLRKIAAEIVDLERDGDEFRLRLAGGDTLRAQSVVLAIGNLPPLATGTDLHRTNPWAPGVTAGLRPDLPVLLLGTGLTMVDLAQELRDAGFAGPVIALSRRGLLPHRHAPARKWPTPDLDDAERGSLSLLLQRMRWEARRAEARGCDWRGVVDSLRPVTADIWRRLPQADRDRFLRHLRPYWDIHRHRLAQPVAERLADMIATGWLRVVRGRVAAMAFEQDRAVATIRRHGVEDAETLTVQRVISATGLQSAAQADCKLIRALCARGLARLDTRAFGLDVTDSLALRDADGQPVPGLWALGPIVRGVFWECIAVPDIRVQAKRVAENVAATLLPSGDDGDPLDDVGAALLPLTRGSAPAFAGHAGE